MRRTAAVKARQRKLREEINQEGAEEEAGDASINEESNVKATPSRKGGRNRKGAISKQKETDTESEDLNVDRKENESAEDASAEEQYEVERIVDMKIIRGIKKYRIRWRGYDSGSDTWETEDNLNCPGAIKEYLEQYKTQNETSLFERGKKNASRKGVISEVAGGDEQDTENDIPPVDKEANMAPAKKRRSPKKKYEKNDDDNDAGDEDDDGGQDKTYETPGKKRRTSRKKFEKKDEDSVDDDDHNDDDDDDAQDKTHESTAKKRSHKNYEEKEEDSVEDEDGELEPAVKKSKSNKKKHEKKEEDTADDVEEEEEEEEEPIVKEEKSKTHKRKAKGKKAETIGNEETENGVDAEEISYEVEKIMEVHHKKNGKKEYLIHWRGYPHSQDTWEPEEHLECEDLIREFEERVNKVKNLSVRELRTERVHTSRYAEETPGKRHSKRGKGKKRATYYDTE